MTDRTYHTNVLNAHLSDEMDAKAQAELDKMDLANDRRRAKNAEKAIARQIEREPIRSALIEVITAEPKTASMLIAEAGVEIKPQSVPSLLRAAVEDGHIMKVPVKIKGKGTQVGYVLC